jgi:hypothetical protein
MSNERSRAIGTLVRWRAFQEALAERESLRAAALAAAAQSALDASEAVAEAISRRREGLLGGGAVDLGMLQAIAEFEHRARDQVRDRRDSSTKAKKSRDEAVALHLSARSRLRVAETRCDREITIESEREEKRVFDRMAALIVASAVEKKHD